MDLAYRLQRKNHIDQLLRMLTRQKYECKSKTIKATASSNIGVQQFPVLEGAVNNLCLPVN